MLDAPDDSPQGVRSEAMVPPIVNVDVKPEVMQKLTGKPGPGVLSWKFTSQRPYQQGQYAYGPADLLIRDIVVNNYNERPIYFAVAVPPSYWVGLENNAVFDGLAARIVPEQHQPAKGLIDGDINEPVYKQVAYTTAASLSKEPALGTINTSYRDPEARRSALDDRYGTQTYFELYGRLANYYIAHGNLPEAHRALDTLAARVPPKLVHYDSYLLQVLGDLYRTTGDEKRSTELAQLAAASVDGAEDATVTNDADPMAALRKQYRMAELYFNAQQYDQARKIYGQMLQALPADAAGDKEYVSLRLAQVDAKDAEKKGDKRAAFNKYSEILSKYQNISQQAGLGAEMQAIATQRDALGKELGISGDSAKGAINPAAKSAAPTSAPGSTPGAAQPATKDGLKKKK
jgi:tetratricopeptide (TPR) repeat protein